MIRHIFTSESLREKMKKKRQKVLKIYSFYPIDRADCSCQKTIRDWHQKMSRLSNKQRQQAIRQQKYLTCPTSRKGLNLYEITCKNCGEIQGYCWASDKTLKDWVDFHYTNWTDGYEWHGCFIPQISPVTQKLCLECTCGQTTRDFQLRAKDIEEKNRVGRDFGRKSSKFKVRRMRKNMIPFNHYVNS